MKHKFKTKKPDKLISGFQKKHS